jgi:hypothetical protein
MTEVFPEPEGPKSAMIPRLFVENDISRKKLPKFFLTLTLSTI